MVIYIQRASLEELQLILDIVGKRAKTILQIREGKGSPLETSDFLDLRDGNLHVAIQNAVSMGTVSFDMPPPASVECGDWGQSEVRTVTAGEVDERFEDMREDMTASERCWEKAALYLDRQVASLKEETKQL
jgi:hypothetical protein